MVLVQGAKDIGDVKKMYRILIIDNDESIRNLEQEVLERAGYASAAWNYGVNLQPYLRNRALQDFMEYL